ncbi:hypothetical protein ASG24_08405 [Methylophilus sp. Leaf414]|nr:hypothetical protein ASG24_08405 [Methylophilus sp. Leaf414]
MFGGITCKSTVNEIESTFGSAANIKTSEDKLRRIYNYPKYNISFGLSEAKVKAIFIFDKSKYPTALQFE